MKRIIKRVLTMCSVAFFVGCGSAPIEIVRPVTVRPRSQEVSEAKPLATAVAFNVLNYMPSDAAAVVQVSGDNFRRSSHVQSIIAAMKASASAPEVLEALADAETLFLNTVDMTAGLPKRESNMSVVFTGNYDVEMLQRLWTALVPQTERETRPDGMTNFSMAGMAIQQIDGTHWLITKDKHKGRLLSTSVPKELNGFSDGLDSDTSIRGWMDGGNQQFLRMMSDLKLDEKELQGVRFWDVRLLLDPVGGTAAHIDFRFECSNIDEATRLNALMTSKGSKPPMSMFHSPPRYRVDGTAAVLTLDVSPGEADMIANEISMEIIRGLKIDRPAKP